MTEGEFPFRSFTMRSEGYDRSEVDSYVEELRSEIVELRRSLDAAAHRGGDGDTRLHDPEGAVTRTLAIAQETADRVLHDAQVEADRRRSEADEHATNTIAEADERAARLLADMEVQAAEIREQGVAAARSAIQVERDKAMAELSLVRRVRDDLRTEAADLKAALDRYRSQAREASDTLAAAATGPLMSLELPDFVDEEVVLAGIVDEDEYDDDFAADVDELEWDDDDVVENVDEDEQVDDGGSHLRAVDDDIDMPVFAEDLEAGARPDLAEVISIDSEASEVEVVADLDDDDDAGSGVFLAEVQAAAEDDVALPPENDESDRFLSELRGISAAGDDDDESDVADRFFDDD